MFIYIAIFVVTLLVIVNWQCHKYWKNKDVSTPSFLPFFGNYFTFLGNRWDKIDEIYKKYKSKKFFGMYECFNPTLFVTDPESVRDVLVKEFDHFPHGRPSRFDNDKYMPEMLFLVIGQKWKALRSLLTPTFTSGKIKAMFPLVSEKADELIQECENEISKKGCVEIYSFLGYYSLDTIATCAFGINAKCLQTKNESDFYKFSNEFFELTFSKLIKFTVMNFCPALFKFLRLKILNDFDFFSDVVDQTIKVRKESQTKRGDFLDILLESLEEESSKDAEHQKYPMTVDTVKSQAILFILAGFETSGTSLAITVHALGKNLEVQGKLRREIGKIVHEDGSFDYQSLMENHYLDACIAEALRLHSPVHVLERYCDKDFSFRESDLTIPKGTIVQIPVWSLHRDEEYWNEPLEYNPERFMPENKSSIIPYTYMPFGLGPRNCIGMRFAHQTLKLGIAKLCYNFEFSLKPGHEDLKLVPTVDTLRPHQDGIQLIMKKIEH